MSLTEPLSSDFDEMEDEGVVSTDPQLSIGILLLLYRWGHLDIDSLMVEFHRDRLAVKFHLAQLGALGLVKDFRGRGKSIFSLEGEQKKPSSFFHRVKEYCLTPSGRRKVESYRLRHPDEAQLGKLF